MECISKSKLLNRPEYFDNKLSKKPFCTLQRLRLWTLTFSVTNLLKICSDEKHSLKYLDGIYVCKSNNVGAESEKKLLWGQMMRPANKTKICFKGQDLQLLKLEALARLTIKLGSFIFICPARYTSSFHFYIQGGLEFGTSLLITIATVIWIFSLKSEILGNKEWIIFVDCIYDGKKQTKPSICSKFETQPFSLFKWKAIRTIEELGPLAWIWKAMNNVSGWGNCRAGILSDKQQ